MIEIFDIAETRWWLVLSLWKTMSRIDDDAKKKRRCCLLQMAMLDLRLPLAVVGWQQAMVMERRRSRDREQARRLASCQKLAILIAGS